MMGEPVTMDFRQNSKNNTMKRRMVGRDLLLDIMNASLKTANYKFAEQLAEEWLAIYPGDIDVANKFALNKLFSGVHTDAVEIAHRQFIKDPLNIELLATLKAIKNNLGEKYKDIFSCETADYILNGKIESSEYYVGWPTILKSAYKQFNVNAIDKAEVLLHQVMSIKPNYVLTAILHLLITHKRGDLPSTLKLADLYHRRWPECLQISLILADVKIQSGDDAGGMQLMHECVVKDIAGVAAKRLWNDRFRYQPMWPDTLEIPLERPIPYDISALFGWTSLTEGAGKPKESSVLLQKAFIDSNKLQVIETSVSGESDDSSTVRSQENNERITFDSSSEFKFSTEEDEVKREKLVEIDEIYTNLTTKLHRTDLQKSEGRFPVYVILSSKTGLTTKYGSHTAQVIDNEMSKLGDYIKKNNGWGSIVFFPDDKDCMLKLGLNPVDKVDPWKIKLALTDLDKSLAKKGSMIGAVLIVGGNEIIPFHQLPNPTDDMDNHVLSDNPYSAIDSNYFIPDWQVGRLPGDNQTDAGLLLIQLRSVISSYSDGQPPKQTLFDKIIFITQSFSRLFNIFKQLKTKKSFSNFGYSASVWRRASIAAFSPIGGSNLLKISPPYNHETLTVEKITEAPMCYFNLHGLEDSPNWYGQRDVLDPVSGPDYPIAITPALIKSSATKSKIIFSEACYGAFVNNKNDDTSMALKFLATGTNCLIGSTCVAYGSISTPLIGADLLANYFLKFVQNGISTGEAFIKAKVEFVHEMKRRQNFLDGEDQKTLLSFVLYGDPLYTPNRDKLKSKHFIRTQNEETISLISDSQDQNSGNNGFVIDEKILQEAKVIVDSYLPGLSGGQLSYTRQHVGNIYNKTTNNQQKVFDSQKPQKVTISKQIVQDKRTHYHYARVTFNSEGKMTKLAISR